MFFCIRIDLNQDPLFYRDERLNARDVRVFIQNCSYWRSRSWKNSNRFTQNVYNDNSKTTFGVDFATKLLVQNNAEMVKGETSFVLDG